MLCVGVRLLPNVRSDTEEGGVYPIENVGIAASGRAVRIRRRRRTTRTARKWLISQHVELGGGFNGAPTELSSRRRGGGGPHPPRGNEGAGFSPKDRDAKLGRAGDIMGNPITAFFNGMKLERARAAVVEGNRSSARGDYADALIRFMYAAKAGVPEGAYNLGLMRMKGEALPQDHAEAARWFRQAAEQGLTQAQFNLSQMYHQGHGVPRDPEESVRWLRMAADQGDSTAQWNLGVRYQDGDGVPKDRVKAEEWKRRAKGG